jgi:hypothetical protein
MISGLGCMVNLKKGVGDTSPNGGGPVAPPHLITGIENSAPSFTPLGQRLVTVLVRV